MKQLEVVMTTKAERKAARRQNRELRKTLRKERKTKFKEIVKQPVVSVSTLIWMLPNRNSQMLSIRFGHF